LGFTGSEPSTGLMGAGDGGILDQPSTGDASLLYFIDSTPSTTSDPGKPQLYGLYSRHDERILGERDDEEELILDFNTSRCFNCGASDHIVSACPSALNHPLISLSRQLFNFLLDSRGVNGEFKRLHVVEAWKQQRLAWLDCFEPGEVRGSLLRDALGWSGGGPEWLKNMAVWGYPKGWVGKNDPRDAVRTRIQDEFSDHHHLVETEDQDEFLAIFGDDGEVEVNNSSQLAGLGKESATDTPVDEAVSETDSDTSSNYSSISASTSSSLPRDVKHSMRPLISTPCIRRWATYPDSYFSSTLLPVYTGFALPPMSNVSATFTGDRRLLWDRIINTAGPKVQSSNVPPWRHAAAWGAGFPSSLSQSSHASPLDHVPPSKTPPPLPPPPPIPIPSFCQNSSTSVHLTSSPIIPDNDDLHGELDMDLSDSD
jgi:zinc finger CCHC domain-containing protein 8